ncbi:MAG: Lrp/AsnC family transcriptional regulator [Chloroflexi bacterium]|nr:MAG: Lrp/AsnC family transcriptional regulator [Chloroflexota bacterium]
MIEYSAGNELDEIDASILQELQRNGRISNADLARHINLSPPATHARLKRLEQAGFIDEYVTMLNRDRLGFDMLCFVNISLQMHQPEEVERFRKAIEAVPEVLECFHVTGEFDYLLKVVIHNQKDLERFLVKRLTPIPGVARIYTSLVVNEVKSTTALPLS